MTTRRVPRSWSATIAAIAVLSALLVPRPASAATYSLMVGGSSDRAAPVALEGATLSGDAFVFVSPEAGATRVRFWLDNPSASGSPTKREGNAPWDFAGTAADGSANPWDTSAVPDGEHTITIIVDLAAGGTETVTSTFQTANGTTPPPPPSSFFLLVSTSSDRSSPVPLDGQTVSGQIFVFTEPETGVDRVRFWLDDPTMSGPPDQIEKGPPFDFAGTANDGSAKPYSTALLVDGPHSITAKITLVAGGSEVVTGAFNVSNAGQPALVMTPSSLTFEVEVGGSAPAQTIDITTSDTVPATYAVSDDAAWLTVTPSSGNTPDQLSASVDSTGLSAGSYTATITATAPDHLLDTVSVALKVGGGCSPLPCSELLVDLPYELDFLSDHGKIADGSGVGTGLTYVEWPSRSIGYLPENLHVDLSGTGTLDVTTTKGLAFQAANSQDNALGVGIDAPSQVTLISTTLANPPAGTGNQEQAGLYFGIDEDNYLKLIVLSSATGTKIQFMREEAGVRTGSRNISVGDVSAADVMLILRADPTDSVNPSVTGSFRINGGAATNVKTFVVSPEWFSFDAAGIDPEIGTRTFAGIFASHRNGSTPLVYSFDQFTASAEQSGGGGGGGSGIGNDGIAFSRTSFTLRKPTSMVWGPDGRLYASEFMGVIHALTLDADNQVVADEVITTLGQRLTLGLTIDPASTPSNLILWAAHSSPTLSAGEVNSSTVTRLSGPGFADRTDVITGLPRALANHAINSIHFGPDGRLYIAQGGNTGAGAPNLANTEFGDRAEQPLSAALLVADVKSATFDGTCNNASDPWGPPPCDVKVYSSGLRNVYDFVFHTNGSIYGPENGLGVTGSFPPSPTPPCRGLANTIRWEDGGHNPGSQPDTLLRLLPGRYYGHPNPYRGEAGTFDNGSPLIDECVFGDGHFQGVSPLANYVPPMYVLGNNRSTNGIIEYGSDAFCSALQGDLLTTSYSKGDDVTRLRLSADGTEVVAASSLVAGFDDPLPIVEGPPGTPHEGTLFVGEFGGNLVTALTPEGTGCWQTATSMPADVLDAGSAAVNGKLYVVAGKNATTHLSGMYVYDPATDQWTSGPALPGPAVENPAAAEHGGKLYVFGGSTAAFTGAVSNAAVFDPSTGQWTSLAPMPTARGGATAKALGGLIFVVGGMDVDGASLATVDVYNPATNTWSSSVAPMSTRRDNPGSAVLDGDLYVFGGRTRNADGTTVANNLASVEMFDPATGSWSPRASMPTGRRTMAVGTLDGRAQVIGGERRADGSAFSTVEEYDPLTDSWRTLIPMPTGRHGPAFGTIGTLVYVAGGATDASASSATNVVEVFGFGS